MEDRLLFLISSPRSGSTLLERMLASHPAILGRAEPHLIPPLAHLGFYGRVDKAPYDPFITHEAARAFVRDLPGGEADYLDALRACTDILYGRMLDASGRRIFLDKTPANALVLPFLAKLYPRARYIVLTRHPVAIFTSFAHSFFDGDFEVAQRHNPLLDRYVPAIARFLRELPAPLVHVRYEQLVEKPEPEMRRILDFLGLVFEPGIIEYGAGQAVPAGAGLGDPITVARHTRPVTESVDKWVDELAADPEKLAFMRTLIARLDPADLATWGYPVETIFDPLARATGGRPPRPRLTRYALERKILVALRRNIRHNALGRILGRLRFALDVLLRD
jgi:hypothetical protein